MYPTSSQPGPGHARFSRGWAEVSPDWRRFHDPACVVAAAFGDVPISRLSGPQTPGGKALFSIFWADSNDHSLAWYSPRRKHESVHVLFRGLKDCCPDLWAHISFLQRPRPACPVSRNRESVHWPGYARLGPRVGAPRVAALPLGFCPSSHRGCPSLLSRGTHPYPVREYLPKRRGKREHARDASRCQRA
jgi:hypothetical protein